MWVAIEAKMSGSAGRLVSTIRNWELNILDVRARAVLLLHQDEISRDRSASIASRDGLDEIHLFWRSS